MRFLDYDTTLAIAAYRMLYFEVRPFSACQNDIWRPIDDQLKALSAANPPSITCLHSAAYTAANDEDPRHVEIHIVGPNRELLFLGTASTREAAIEDWWEQISTIFTLTGAPSGSMAWHGASTHRRDYSGSIIPIDTDEIDEQSCATACQIALNHYAPQLGTKPITWLDDQLALRLYTHLYTQAKQSATAQTAEEKVRITRQEYDAP